MTPQELGAQMEGLVIDANNKFYSRIVGVQGRLHAQLVRVLKDVEIDAEGYIIQSAVNRKVLNDAIGAVDDALASGTTYTDSIEKYLETIPSLDDLNVLYFNTISTAFTPNRQFIKSLQRQVISSMEISLLNDGLESQVKGPLMDILNRNINTGGSYSGFLQEVRDYVTGNSEIEGRLLSYSRNIVKDALTIYARSFQQAVTADLKLEWYLYAGGLIDTSRPFCVERAGRYYHESEIKTWAHEDWAGKMRGTTESSIFQFCGGYSCGHQLIPVHVSMVPQADIDRLSA